MNKSVDFRLDKIEFENYKGYKEKQIFDFTTDRSFMGNYSTSRKTWKYSKPKTIKYKKVLGIYGYNSSGKSSVFEIISLWRTWVVKLNENYFKDSKEMDFLHQPTDFLEILNFRYSRTYKDSKSFRAYSFFNDKKKPLRICFYFSVNLFSFKHELIRQYSTEETSKIKEKIYLLNQGSIEEEKIWDSDENKNSLSGEIEFIEFLNNQVFSGDLNEKLEKFSENKQKAILLIKGLQKVENINKKNAEELKVIWQCIKDFLESITIIDPPIASQKNSFDIPYFLSHFTGIDSINDHLTRIYKVIKKNDDLSETEIIDKIKKIIIALIKTLDSNIKKVDVELLKDDNKEEINFKSIINKNNVKNFPEELSTGTINFLDLSLKIFYKKMISETKDDNKNVNYIFIDELGLNWHTNLTIEFINRMINEDFMSEDSTIIFTSHDALVADNLPVDSLYIIDNENNLKKVSSLTNDNDDRLRKNVKFSKNYLNSTLDPYSSTPNFDNFDELKELVKNVKSK